MCRKFLRIFCGIAAIAVILGLPASNYCEAANESSPWGIVAVWPVNEPGCVCHYNAPWQISDDGWRDWYCPELDSVVNCGLVWVRPNCIKGQKNDGGLFTNHQDSLVKFAMIEHDLELLMITFPNKSYCGGDTSEWKSYWDDQVERYDGDDYNDMPGFSDTIKYWNICNEPYHWRNSCYNGNLEHFRKYVRASARGIDSASSIAKVVAPSMAGLINRWDTLKVGNTVYRIDSIPDYFWGQILDNGGANYIDVISVHRYEVSPSKVFSELDSLKTLLNNHGAGNKPVWMTETGWDADSIDLQYQAEWYRGFCEEMLEDTVLDKVFFFAMRYDVPGAGRDWGICDTDLSHRPAYDTLKEWILPPAAPTGLHAWCESAAFPGFVTINLAWNSNSESDLEGYNVYHQSDGGNWGLLKTTTDTTASQVVRYETVHYYYVTAFDLAGNESDGSDTIRVVARPEASPFVFVWDGTEFVIDNSILPACEIVSEVNTDYYKIEAHLEEQNNRYLLQIIESGSHHTYLDQIKLLAVDHPEDEELSIGTTSDGDIIAYEETASPISCQDNYGNDWLDSVKTVGDGYYSGEDGDWLDLDFGELDEEDQVIIVGTWMAAKFALHVQIQEDDEWEDASVVYPSCNVFYHTCKSIRIRF
jgi:hypothetical protein